MAGDWIKMRTDLFTHPKVVRISSALKADRLRTVGGLMSVWCLFDAHSVDGQLEGYSCETLDEMVGWSGFSAAMKSVGWLDETAEGLVLPDFEAHNGQSAKRRAQDADRKREGRLSASDADKKRTREEKRREEKKEEKKQTKSDAPPPAVLPDWLPLDSWQGYLDMRAKKRKPPTPHAVDLLLRQLSKMRDAGQNIAAVLDKSTVNGWTDVYEIKGGSGGAPAGEQQQFGAAGQATARAAQQWMENGNA